MNEETLQLLREALEPARVDTRPVTLEAYSRDLSALGHLMFALGDNEPGPGIQPPEVVVHPTSVEEVQAVVRVCHAHSLPIVPWGAGSGVCGGTLAIHGGVALDLKRLDRILELDHRSQLVRVEAGMNLQLLEDALQREGLTLGHHPSSITCCTIGGALAARGAGQLSTRYGKAEDMTVAIEVVLADGTLVKTAVTPRSATGPDWNHLFVGCEGTLGILVAATLRLQRLPALRVFQSWEFRTLHDALAAIRESLQRGARPAAVRLYDPLDTLMVARASDGPPFPASEEPGTPEEAPLGSMWPLSRLSLGKLTGTVGRLVPEVKKLGMRAFLGRPELANRLTANLPGVGCLLVLTCEGEPELARAEATVLERICLKYRAVDKGPQPAEVWWRNRLAVSFKQTGVYAIGGFVDTMEVATTWANLETLHDRVRTAIGRHALVMAHFSHAYADGCSIYFTFAGLQEDRQASLERFQAAWRDGLEAVVATGAAVSHHHGVGILKADALKASQGALHEKVFVPVKRTLDPKNVLNPGKLGLPE